MKTQLVGILNVTPDSFSDGGDYESIDKAISHAKQIFADGACFVDVGGEATNPWVSPLSAVEEWSRIKDILYKIISLYPNKISLDTYHPESAQKFFELGGSIINDVSGFQNKDMIDLAVKYKPLCIVNHFPGKTVKDVHKKQIDSLEIVRKDLIMKADLMVQLGVPKSNIILDPGIGFGKTMNLNKKLLKFAELVPDFPVMVGYSRKRFLGDKRFQVEPNLEAAKIAISHGAKYIRVHDVKAHADLLKDL